MWVRTSLAAQCCSMLVAMLVGQSHDSFHVLLKPGRKVWQRESERSLRCPQVFIIQNGRQPRTQEERVEGDGTERLGAKSALPIMQSWPHVALEMLECCFIVATLSKIYGSFCNSHLRTLLRDAQLRSAGQRRSALTQLSPTQEERTEVWRSVLWNTQWDLQDVCPRIMMHRHWGDAGCLTHVTTHSCLVI